MEIGESEVELSRLSVEIIYATETGNSQEAAEYIQREFSKYQIISKLVSIDQVFEQSILSTDEHVTKLKIFVISTRGQGDIPKPMEEFWECILKKDFEKFIESEENRKYQKTFDFDFFMAFGLGDSSYRTFNFAVRKLVVRLKQIGKNLIGDVGLGDDADAYGYFDKLEQWVKKSILDLEHFFGLNIKHNYQNDFLGPCIYTVEICFDGKLHEKNLNKLLTKSCIISTNSLSFKSKILSRKRLTSNDHFQIVENFVFSGNKCFDSGDVVKVYPSNSNHDVNIALQQFSLKKNDIIKIEFAKSNSFENCKFFKANGIMPVLIRAFDLFSDFLDITGTPKIDFFEKMLHFTKNELEKEKLKEFISKKGRNDFYKFCTKENRTYIECLQCFPNVKMPLNFFIQSVPLIKPREFSISNAFDVFLLLLK